MDFVKIDVDFKKKKKERNPRSEVSKIERKVTRID